MQNRLFSEAASRVSARIAAAVPDGRRAAEVERQLRTYPLVWALTFEPDLLSGLLTAALDDEPYWWRPARVGLRAVSIRCRLSNLDAAEAWLLDDTLHPARDEKEHPDRAIAELLTKQLMIDTRRALAWVSACQDRSATPGIAREPEGVLICLYDLNLRVASRQEVLSWLSEVACQRPVSAARVALLNEPAADLPSTTQEIVDHLDRWQAVAFVHAIADAGATEVAAQLSTALSESLLSDGSKSPTGRQQSMSQTHFDRLHRYWESGMVAIPGDPPRAVRDLEQAWDQGRSLSAAISLELGRLHLRDSDRLAALAAFRQGLALVPDHEDLRAEASQLLNDLSRYDQALELASSAESSRRAADLAIQRARALMGLGDVNQVKAAVEKAAGLATTPVQHRDVAQLLSTWGKEESAATHLEQALEAAPDRSDWFAELGDIYAAQSQWSAARTCYQQWLAMEPGNSVAMLKLCLALRTLGELPAALEVVDRAVQLSPQEPAVLVEWLTVAHQAQQWETAVQAGVAALAVKPDSSAVHLMVGRAYGALGDPGNALFHLRRATQLPFTDGDPSRPWLALTDLVEGQGDVAQTESVLKEGLRDLGETSQPLLVRLGDFYEKHGRPTEAQAAYWQAYQAGNRSSTMLTRFGRVLGKLGHQEQAVARLEEAAEQSDATGQTYYHLSRALERVNRQPEAVAAARQAAKLIPNDGEVLLHAGRLCLAHRDGAAADYLAAAVSHFPRTPEVYELLGESHELVGNWKEAAAALWSALRLDPANPQLQHKIGIASFNLGELETAITLLQEAAERFPQDITVKESLGMVLENAGWWNEATRVRQEAAELAPADPERLLSWARTARRAGDLAAAEEAITRAQQVSPKSRVIKLERALIQKASSDRSGALKTLRDLVRDCDDPLLLWQAGDTFIEMGQSGEGVAAFSRVADLRPDDPEAHVRLAQASTVVGNQQQALAAYEAAAQLEPGNPQHYVAIGAVHWERSEFARAAQAWSKAQALNPGDLAVTERLAHAYARMGDPAAALQIFEDVASRGDPESASVWQAWREAGRAALALGEFDRARSCLTKVLKSAPTDPETFSLVGALADQLGKEEDALKAYRKAAQLAPAERAYQLQLADALTKIGRNLDAVNVWERLMDDAEDIDQAAAMLVQMGKLYARAGRYDEAERVLRTALQQAPDDRALQALLANVLVEKAERADYQSDSGLCVPDPKSDVDQALSWLETPEAPRERRDLARALLLVGRVHEAISGLNSYLANIRSDLSAQRSLGVAYRRARSFETSIDVLSMAQRLAPSDERTAVELAKSYLAADQPETAVTLLDRLARHAPESAVVLYYLAEAQEAAGERAAAIQSLQQAVQRLPEAGAWHRMLSRWLRHGGAAAAALPHAEACARNDPGTLSEVELAQALSEVGRAEEAIPHWQAAVKAEPENSDWWRELGDLLLEVGQAESAVKSFEYAGRLAPDDASVHRSWTEALLNMGRVDEAGRHAQRAVALTPDHPAARAALGRWQAAKGAWHDALASFQTAVLWATDEASDVSALDRAEYLLEAARAYHALGATDQALQELERAVELAPSLSGAFIMMGDLYREQGQQDLARQAYQHAAQVAPQNTCHLLHLAQFLQKEGQLDQALDWLMRAIAARPTASLWLEVARVYEQRDQRNKQREALLEAVRLEPASSEAHFELGVLYKQRKEYQRAIEEFDKATELDPNNTEAHKQLSAVLAISLASRIGGGERLVSRDG